jgi:hypothetical protein
MTQMSEEESMFLVLRSLFLDEELTLPEQLVRALTRKKGVPELVVLRRMASTQAKLWIQVYNMASKAREELLTAPSPAGPNLMRAAFITGNGFSGVEEDYDPERDDV